MGAGPEAAAEMRCGLRDQVDRQVQVGIELTSLSKHGLEASQKLLDRMERIATQANENTARLTLAIEKLVDALARSSRS